MKINITNQEIWNYINLLNSAFGEEKEELILPAKIAYIIEYNKSVLYQKYELIEKARINVGKKYGNLIESGAGYNIPKEKIELAQMELEQVLTMNQVVDIIMLQIGDLESCELTLKQMKALLFMVEKKEE